MSEAVPSSAVVESVAAREGVPPSELSAPLAESVDPEALDQLFRNRTGRVVFEYLSYEVTVHDSGDVALELLTDTG